MDLNSKQLEIIQNSLVDNMKLELEQPNCNFEKIAELSKVAEIIDLKRRKVWNEEKFGAYENVFDMFCSDDIPF